MNRFEFSYALLSKILNTYKYNESDKRIIHIKCIIQKQQLYLLPAH